MYFIQSSHRLNIFCFVSSLYLVLYKIIFTVYCVSFNSACSCLYYKVYSCSVFYNRKKMICWLAALYLCVWQWNAWVRYTTTHVAYDYYEKISIQYTVIVGYIVKNEWCCFSFKIFCRRYLLTFYLYSLYIGKMFII